VAAREGDVKKKKVRAWCLDDSLSGAWGSWVAFVVVVSQEEKKAIQDAMIAKIVAEAKRKQAEEDEMRMVGRRGFDVATSAGGG
jgi:hypothetical protein